MLPWVYGLGFRVFGFGLGVWGLEGLQGPRGFRSESKVWEQTATPAAPPQTTPANKPKRQEQKEPPCQNPALKSSFKAPGSAFRPGDSSARSFGGSTSLAAGNLSP